jgi:hypothetical protein
MPIFFRSATWLQELSSLKNGKHASLLQVVLMTAEESDFVLLGILLQ